MKKTKKWIYVLVFSTMMVGCKKADMISPTPANSQVVQSLSMSGVSPSSDQEEKIKAWLESEKSKLEKWYKSKDERIFFKKWYSSFKDVFRKYEKQHLRSDQYQARLAYINQCAGLNTSPYSYKYQDPSTGLLSFQEYMDKLDGTIFAVKFFNDNTNNVPLHQKYERELQKLRDILESIQAQSWYDLDGIALDMFKKKYGLNLFLTNNECGYGPGPKHQHFWEGSGGDPDVAELPIYEQRLSYVQWQDDFNCRFEVFKKSL